MDCLPNSSTPHGTNESAIQDVLIVGGGISGINAACRLTDSLPHVSYTLLEGRSTLGGTWDLFKYPGIRSDSDLHTFGYAFKAWRGPAIAHGPEIMRYLNGVVEDYAISAHTQLDTQVQEASWSSADELWTVTTVHARTGEAQVYRARFFWNCCGYYDYDCPLEAHIPGLEAFEGTVVHPQFWNLEEEEYSGKRVAIVGSGATAITLLPSLAPSAAHVTLVQRSPSYIVAADPNDSTADLLHSLLPEDWASFFIRQKNIAVSYFLFHLAKTFPSVVRRAVLSAAKNSLPPSVSIEKDFTPRYNPWEQRVCLSPNGDFYQAITDGSASIATGNIATVHPRSIELDNGTTVDADIIVTATGLQLRLGGGIRIVVDGKAVELSQRYVWRGCMLEDVPNFAFTMGYTNISWTLGSDCTAHLVIRLLTRLAESKKHVATPSPHKRNALKEASLIDLDSTYIKRARAQMPKVATSGPWQRRSNYWVDMWNAKYAALDQLVFA